MRFFDVNDEKFGLVLVLTVELFEGTKLVPEGGSRVTAKNEHNRSLALEARKLHLAAAVHALELEVRCRIARANGVPCAILTGPSSPSVLG